MKKIIVCILLICCLFSLCSCDTPTEEYEYVTNVSESATTTKEEIFTFATHIVHCTVLEKTAEYFTNPNGDKTAQDGQLIRNVWITEYKVKIHQIFKGELETETITVRSFNGSDQSVDTFVVGQADDFYLDEGQECILALNYLEDTAGYYSGWSYISLYDELSYFLPTETEGQFANSHGLTLELATLSQEISETLK